MNLLRRSARASFSLSLLAAGITAGLLACAHSTDADSGGPNKTSPHDASPREAPPPVEIVDPRARVHDASSSETGATDSGPEADAADASLSVTAPEGMKLVPGGSFTMGTDTAGQGDERPAHVVTLAPFFLDTTEVTHTAYGECVKAGACRPPDPRILSRFGGVFVGPQKPVTGISWNDARAYCTFRGKRLPREAEMERAIRGDDGRRYPWGNEAPTHERTVFQASKTEDVGTHPTGRGPYGHDDLAGNVWEWMEDLYDPFAYSRAGAPKGEPGTCDEILAAQNKLRAEGKQGFTGTNPIPTECERAIRAGAYNYDADGLRSTNRVHHPGNFKLLMTGARCAKS